MTVAVKRQKDRDPLSTARTTFVLKRCDFRAPAAKVDFAYYFGT